MNNDKKMETLAARAPHTSRAVLSLTEVPRRQKRVIVRALQEEEKNLLSDILPHFTLIEMVHVVKPRKGNEDQKNLKAELLQFYQKKG